MQRPLAASAAWPTEQSNDDMISLGEIISSLFQRKLVILLSALATGLVGYLYINSLVDTYSASSEIMLYPQQEKVLSSEAVLASRNPDDILIATEIEILKSRVMAELVVEEYELQDNPIWNGTQPTARGAKLWLSNVFGNKKSSAPLSVDKKKRNAIDRVVAMTRAHQVGDSLIISIEATAFEPQMAANIANTIRENYIKSQAEFTNQSTSRATEWLQVRLEELEKDLSVKENSAASYRESRDLLSTAGSTLTEQQVRDTQEAVSEARANLLEKEAQLDQIKQAASASDRLAEISFAVGSAQVEELRRRQAENSALLAELSTTYGDAHPEILSTKAEARDLQKQIDVEVRRIINSVQDEVELAKKRLVLAEQDKARYEGRLAENNRSLVRLNELEREASTTREMFEEYTKRFQEVRDQASLGLNSTVRVITEAVEPSRSNTPSLALGLIACLGIGGLMGVGGAFTLNAMDDLIRTKRDIDRFLDLSVLGIVPKTSLGYFEQLTLDDTDVPIVSRLLGDSVPPWEVLIKRRLSRYAEAFRLIMRNVHFLNAPSDKAVVTITSAVPKEGKTCVSISLARSAALSGKSVLLIDCDTYTRSTTLGLKLPTEHIHGWTSLIEATDEFVDWASLSYVDEKTGLHVFGSGPDDKHIENLFAQDKIADLLKQAGEQFDLVVLDTPPLLALSDAITLSQQSDQTLLVVRSGVTPAHISKAVIQQLETSGGEISGVILNSVQTNAHGLFNFGDRSFYRQIQQSYYPS